MAELIYSLCTLTSVGCALLLVRGYRRQRTSLLLWSALCFSGLALNSALTVLDLLVFAASSDLSLPRAIVAAAAMVALVIGLVWSKS
jgi:hypothetical protein